MDKDKFSGDGLFFFGSLDKYDGTFNNGKLEGQGKMSYRDGHIYIGQFQDWRQFGPGKMTFRNGDVVDGVWDGDSGQGTITYTDGSMYEGEFKKDKKHGTGTYTYPDGNKYTGSYKVCSKLFHLIHVYLDKFFSRMIWRMEMVHLSGLMDTNTQELSEMVSKQDMENIITRMETATKACLKLENFMEKESTVGQTEPSMLENTMRIKELGLEQ